MIDTGVSLQVRIIIVCKSGATYFAKKAAQAIMKEEQKWKIDFVMLNELTSQCNDTIIE